MTFATIILIFIPGLGYLAVLAGAVIMLVAGIMDLIAMYKSSVACRDYDAYHKGV